MSAPSSLARRLLGGVVFGVLVYLGITVWIGWEGIRDALSRFPLGLLPLVCCLSLANYGIRFFKWERYRRLLDIELERGTSFLIYMAGFSMGVTPGKMGEVLKSWLIKKTSGVRIHHSAPIVVAERVTDLLGYLILAAVGGIASRPEYQWIFWSVLALCGVVIALAGSQAFSTLVFRVVKATPYFWRFAPKVQGSFASTRVLLSPREIVLPTLLSVLSWGCECVGFWLIADAMVDGDLPFLFAVFAYAFSAVAGAVLILFPGGIGPTEGFLGSLLRREYQGLLGPPSVGAGGGAGGQLGLHPALSGLSGAAYQEALLSTARSLAGAAVIIARLCTLWFGVGVGLIALGMFRRRFGELEESALDEEE